MKRLWNWVSAAQRCRRNCDIERSDPLSPQAAEEPVGSVSLDFDDASSATMTYTVNGITQVKRIERLAY